MDTQQDTRTLFLEEFIKRLIIKSMPKPPKIEKGELVFEKLDKAAAKPPVLEITKKAEEPKIEEKKELPKIEEKPKETAREQILKPTIMTQTSAMPSPTPEKPPIIVMDRLKAILADPAVQVINCPGPNQNILVTRLGMTQKMPISFNMNEISSFMKEVSEKTRIPLLPGLFKVIFQNMLITAVVSEFIGTKFIIEKRLMVQPLSAPVRAQFK